MSKNGARLHKQIKDGDKYNCNLLCKMILRVHLIANVEIRASLWFIACK